MSQSPLEPSQTRLHFVGIGGIGMSGIAEVFLNQGYQVSGSDVAESEATRRLESLGAKISIGHRPENVDGATVVIVSSAIRPTNPEVLEARRRRITIIPRAEMLGELMRGKTGIAVAGTHGKTTTTSMLAFILSEAGLDPTLVIGGRVDSLGGNAKLGKSQWVVAEADESDGSFHHLPATYAVVTNIDNDHLDFFGSLTAVEDAFVAFVGKLPFYGMAAVCGDDPGVRRCLPRFTKPVSSYGFGPENDLCAEDLRVSGMGSAFQVYARSGESVRQRLGEVTLRIPGKHNVLNALAAITLARRLGISFEKISGALAGFQGVKRRFEVRWSDDCRKQAVVDDYGHHPTEIAATLSAARGYWPGRIISVFQPHRYSRTLHCQDGFTTAFQDSDLVIVTDIYAAGEEPLPNVSGEELAQRIRASLTSAGRSAENVVYVGTIDDAKSAVIDRVADGDLVLCMGAGSITQLPARLIQDLEKRR